MKRKIKNIIMLVLIILISIGAFFTMKYLSPNDNNQMPGGPSMQMGTPPSVNNSSNDNNTPPEKPSTDTSTSDNSSNDNNISSEKQSNNDSNMPQMPSNMNQNNTNNILFYTLIISESIGLSLLIMYLIMSNFNKK